MTELQLNFHSLTDRKLLMVRGWFLQVNVVVLLHDPQLDR